MARILVVDDDDQIRRMLTMYLEGKGHTVAVAEDGEEGLAIIQAGNLDLVITDLEMPMMKGHEMLIKAGYPPAILASGRFTWLVTNADKVREFPMLDSLIGRCTFVAKPFNWVTFERAVNDALAT